MPPKKSIKPVPLAPVIPGQTQKIQMVVLPATHIHDNKVKSASIPAKVTAPASRFVPSDPLSCRSDGFPQRLLDFASKNGITPLKWRIQNGEYILFSDRLQKYHVPMS